MNEKLTVLKDGMLRYRYDVNRDIGFDFHTLAEVGAPFQSWFRNEIARRGLKVQFGRFIEEKPYVADFVIK